jgi:hypothetical protein
VLGVVATVVGVVCVTTVVLVVAVVLVVGGAVGDLEKLLVANNSWPFGVRARSVTSPLNGASPGGATHSSTGPGGPATLIAKMAFMAWPEVELAPPK